MIISPEAQRVLKVVHLLTVSYWIGGCVALITLLLVSGSAETGSELYGILRSMNIITLIVVVYLGAYGSFFTGLAYSICTNRGFVRHKWVVLKWSMTIAMIFTGAFWMGPKKIIMMELVMEHGLGAMALEAYQEAETWLMLLFALQLAMFVVCTVLSVYKPWEREELAERYKHVRPVSKV